MSILIISIHVFVCIVLIMVVLLQTGKGADMGAAFGGGGSQALFGSTGASTFLSKATTVVAIVFMLTSLVLAYISGHRSNASIMLKESAPIEQTETVKEPVAKEAVSQPAPATEATETAGETQTAAPAETNTSEPSAMPNSDTAN